MRPRREKTPSPPPEPERPTTPLPKYITDYKDEPWFTQYFPNLTEKVMWGKLMGWYILFETVDILLAVVSLSYLFSDADFTK